MQVPRKYHPALLHAMWPHARTAGFCLGSKLLHPTIEQCTQRLDEDPYVDYLFGKGVKTNFVGEELDFSCFNEFSHIKGEEIAMELMTRPGFDPQTMVL